MLTRIKADLLKARKDQDEFKKRILTALVSEAVMIGKNMGNRETTDAETMKVVQKFKKGALDTLELLGGSLDRMSDYPPENSEKCITTALEIGIYNEYLPTQLSDDEIVREIGMHLQVNSEKANIGSVMAHFKNNFDGRYDGKVLAKLTNEILRG